MSAKPALAFPTISILPKSQPVSLWATSACILLMDFATLSAVYLAAVFGHYLIGSTYNVGIYLKLFPYSTLLLGVFVIQGLYPGLLLHPAEEIRKVFNCVTVMFLLIGAGTFLWRNAETYSRSVFLLSWALGAPAVLLGRHFLRSLFAKRDWWGIPAVVLVSGKDTARVVRGLRNARLGIRVKGILSDDRFLPWSPDLPPVLGRLAFAPLISESKIAQYAIIMMSQRSSKEIEYIIQHYCKGFRHVLLVPDLPGLCSLGITAREIGGDIGFEVPQHLFHRSRGILKRALDTAASVMMLAMLSPLFLVVAILIKATSKGPVFYRHRRYGRNAHEFRALKFRTMVQNADRVLADYLKEHPSQLSEWECDQKLKNDPRVTCAGKWLRRFSIDELPQLWNVLVGDMSLVGPRPIVQDEIGRYGTGYDLYTRVLPGITGLWQVSGRNNTTYPERVALDEYYVRNWSIWLDTYILARTFRAVLSSEGAY